MVAGEQCKFYNASSPDELALVNGMRHFGFAFMERDIDDNIVVDHDGTIKKSLIGLNRYCNRVFKLKLFN